MITKTINNQQYQFPDGTSDDQINKYLKKADPNKRGVIKDIGFSALDGVRDGVQSTIGLVEQLGDTLGEKTGLYGVGFGDGDGKFNLADLKPELLSYEEAQEKGIIASKLTLPDFDRDPDTVAGNLTKGISQFLTGWFTGGRILKGAKAVTGTGQLAKSVARGSIADFQAFDENTGRLVDMVNENFPALENPIFEYLESDADDTWYEARFKNALEGAGLGGVLEGSFRAFRWYKNKKGQANGEPFNKKLLEEDEKYLNGINEEDLTLTKYKPLNDDFATEVTKNLELELEEGIFSTFSRNQEKFIKKEITSKEFDGIIDDLDISSNFNIKKMIELDEKGLISEIAFTKAFNKLVRDKKIVISDELVERQARRLYENKSGVLEGDIAKLADDIRKAPATIVATNAYRNFLNNSVKRMAMISAKEPKAKQLLLKVFLPKLQLVNAGKESISANIARTQRLQATSFNTKIAKDQEGIIKQFDEYGGDVDEFIRKIGASGNADLTTIFQSVTNNSTWDIANEVWINALLSNPKTHIINMTSNMINMFIRPLEKAMGSRMTFGNSAKSKALRAEGAKALGTYISMGRYLKDAVKYAGIALRKEDGILTSRNKLDTPKKSIQKTKLVDGVEVLDDSLVGKGVNFLGKVIRQPSRFLTAEDEFFKQIQYRTHLERWAFDKAIKNGKSQTKIVASDVRTKQPITEFQQAVIENFESGFTKEGRARIKSVLKMAEEGTYTNELTGIFKRVGDMTNEFPILKQILPFTRTPVNLMLNVVDRTGLGFIRKQYRNDFFGKNGAERMAQARGQLATGFGLMLLANKLVAEGQLTGVQGQVKGEKLTNSRELRELKKASGRVPYAFRYYDDETQTFKYREFGRFDPFGAFFGLVVDYHTFRDQLDEETATKLGSNIMLLLAQQGGDMSDYLSTGDKASNMLSAMGSSVTRNLVSKTYLKGLAEFMEVITDDDPSKWGRWAKSKAGSFVPNIYNKFVNDPFYRDSKTILEEMKKRAGTEEIEFKYDFRGNALKIQGDENTRLINGVFNPFGEKEAKADPVAEEIFRLGVNMPSMKTTLRGDVDLTLFTNKKGQTSYNRQQELLRKIKIGGFSLDQKLQQVIGSSGYQRLSDPIGIDRLNKDTGGKAKMMRSIIKDYHTAVEEQIIKESKGFKSSKDDTGKFTLFNSLKAINNNLEKMKMGITINPSDLNSLYQFSK